MSVAQKIATWAVINRDTILRLYLQKGGWEGWAQCEIANYWANSFRPEDINIFREEGGVYKSSGSRADLYITYKNATPDVIELKCESMWNSNNFLNQFSTDLRKINGDIKLSTYSAHAIGFTVSTQRYNSVIEARAVDNNSMGVNVEILYDDPSGFMKFAMFYKTIIVL